MGMTSRLNKQSIMQSFEDGVFTGGVHLFDTIDSTNDWSLAEIKNARQLPFVCIADHQNKGRGRRGRHWLSPPGANIYMSLAWYFELSADRLGLLSLAQGVAVLNALSQIGINNAWLKWPNDVLIEDEKIAGVLVETSGLSSRGCKAVIGIGLNYAMPENITIESGMRWTDVVHSVSGVLPDRNVVVTALLNEVVNMCRRYQQNATAIFTDIKGQLDAITGRDVCVHTENGDLFTGKVLGINQLGELRVLVKGHEHIFNSADVSLKGINNSHEPGERHADD
jgi:BirA family biotin operon repressor/biotin-[acetyl-CoA-carboxylase] ligase